jgi:hypothetical protein
MAWRYCKEARKKKHLDDQVGGSLKAGNFYCLEVRKESTAVARFAKA